ncbi:MAG TPA: hypothetical protein VJB59_11585 [Bdellovibrionota bacterium]|nr:hypothetical protein [Bdellovibrionota bacterium]
MDKKQPKTPTRVVATPEVLDTKRKQSLHQSIEERLAQIHLLPNDELIIERKELASTIVDTVTSFIPGADQIKRVLETQSKIDSKIKERKSEILIEAYMNKADSHEAAILGLARLFTDLRTSLLYKQLDSKMGSELPSKEVTEMLSSALKKVLETNLDEQFDSHKAVVRTIVRMDTQSLLLLKDHEEFPITRSQGRMMDSTDAPDSSVDWSFRCAKAYLEKKGITEEAIIFHFRACLEELLREGCISVKSEVNGNDLVLVSSFGDQILKYIS